MLYKYLVSVKIQAIINFISILFSLSFDKILILKYELGFAEIRFNLLHILIIAHFLHMSTEFSENF